MKRMSTISTFVRQSFHIDATAAGVDLSLLQSHELQEGVVGMRHGGLTQHVCDQLGAGRRRRPRAVRRRLWQCQRRSDVLPPPTRLHHAGRLNHHFGNHIHLLLHPPMHPPKQRSPPDPPSRRAPDSRHRTQKTVTPTRLPEN